jgi:phosphatidyl-myo-inositol dimannoside synthase
MTPERTARVLVVTPDFPPGWGGIQQLAERLATGFDRFETRVVTLGRPDDAAAWPIDVVRTGGSGDGRRRAILRLNAAAVRDARTFRPDVVLSLHVNAAPAAILLRRLHGVPYVQYVYAKELGARPRLTRLALRNADTVISISRFSRELALAYGAAPARTVLVHPGVDFPDGPCAQRNTNGIVSVSRLDDEHKGHDVLMAALPKVRAAVPDARLVIAGAGRLQARYEQLGRRLGLDGAVQFVGAVDEPRKWELLRGASVFALPSRVTPAGGAEGFGIVYVEAGAAGLPVVAGAAGGAADAVEDGRTGLLVDAESPTAVAAALVRLLQDREEAGSFAAAGRARAEGFRWPKVVARVEDVLLAVAGASR